MGGSPGYSAPMSSSQNNALNKLGGLQAAGASGGVTDLLNKYRTGGISLNDAISQSKGLGSTTYDPTGGNRDKAKLGAAALSSVAGHFPTGLVQSTGTESQFQNDIAGSGGLQGNVSQDNQEAFLDSLATDPMAGSMYAKEQVMKDPTLAGLFGDDGLQSQAEGQYGTASGDLSSDRNSLMGRDESYGLQDSDLKAYGQASGNIGRMFAGQEQSLAQNLSDRGLGAAPSGAAGQSFSGLMGNKMEQLAGMQQQIAQNRIQTAQGLAQARTNADLQRQSQAGSLASNLGQLGQGAIQNQFGRQIAGSENKYNQLAGTTGLNMQNQDLQQNVNNSQMAQKEATKTPDFGTTLGNIGSGLLSGFASGFTGKAGGNLANKLIK